MSPGIIVVVGEIPLPPPPSRFNEAEATKPRNSAQHRLKHDRIIRFNEAGAEKMLIGARVRCRSAR